MVEDSAMVARSRDSALSWAALCNLPTLSGPLHPSSLVSLALGIFRRFTVLAASASIGVLVGVLIPALHLPLSAGFLHSHCSMGLNGLTLCVIPRRAHTLAVLALCVSP